MNINIEGWDGIDIDRMQEAFVSEPSTSSSIIGFDRALEAAELKIKTDMISSMAALALKHQDTTKEQKAELSDIVSAATKEYQDKVNELPANMRYAVWNFRLNS